MDAQQLDAIVRTSGITLLLLLAMILVRDSKGARLAPFFLPLAVCLCGFLAGNTPDLSLRLTGIAGELAHLVSGYAAVFLWWFCLAGFDSRFKPRGPVLALGVAWLLIASADRGLFGRAVADRGLSWVLVALGFAMMLHLGWRMVRDRRGDLVEGRREARIWAAALLAAQLLLDLTADLVFGLDWRPRAFAVAQNAAILAFTVGMIWQLLRAGAERVSHGPIPAGPIGDAEAGAGLAERLRVLIEVERLHLDPGMTFDAFVRRMGAPERAVRQLINHRLGHDHFRTFLNAHRMAEARRLLADPRRSGDKLIAIALDSGFASLASFNRVFREAQGCTPSAYRQALRAGSGDALGGPRAASRSWAEGSSAVT